MHKFCILLYLFNKHRPIIIDRQTGVWFIDDNNYVAPVILLCVRIDCKVAVVLVANIFEHVKNRQKHNISTKE